MIAHNLKTKIVLIAIVFFSQVSLSLATTLLSKSKSIIKPTTFSKIEDKIKKTLSKIKEISHLSGHVKMHATDYFIPKNTVLNNPFIGTGSTKYNLYGEFRLNTKFYPSSWATFVCENVVYLFGGTLLKQEKKVLSIFNTPLVAALMPVQKINDDREILDLTFTFTDKETIAFYDRIDRLYFNLQWDQGQFQIGRQSVTWGNGFIYNPMDLANPFRPTDIQRDYKIGADMLYTNISLDEINGNYQMLYVPRRDPETHEIKGLDESTLAGKLRFAINNLTFDTLGAYNYADTIVGAGVSSSFNGAGLRLDTTWTFLDQDNTDSYLSLVANLDYYWVWWGKNFSGFIEYYYNGLGGTNYHEDLMNNQPLMDAILRGYLFTLGKNYVSANFEVAISPLLNLSLTSINSIHDISGILLPRLTWNVNEDIEAWLGAMVYLGGLNSEYGGIKIIPGIDLYVQNSNSIFCWIEYFF